MTFNFKTQNEVGMRGERTLDDYFTKFYTIRPVPLDLQKLGIDRIFVNRRDGTRFTVEYKTDLKATHTGNIFLEYEVDKKPGWVLASVAQVLVYYVPPKAYLINMYSLRQDFTSKILSGPPSSEIPNPNYYALGVLIPLARLVYPVLINIINIGALNE